MGYYLDDKFVLLITEDSQTTPFVKLKHNAVIAKFSFLKNHLVKKDWLEPKILSYYRWLNVVA